MGLELHVISDQELNGFETRSVGKAPSCTLVSGPLQSTARSEFDIIFFYLSFSMTNSMTGLSTSTSKNHILAQA